MRGFPVARCRDARRRVDRTTLHFQHVISLLRTVLARRFCGSAVPLRARISAPDTFRAPHPRNVALRGAATPSFANSQAIDGGSARDIKKASTKFAGPS